MLGICSEDLDAEQRTTNVLLIVTRNFVKEAEEISSNRRMNTLTLNRHTEILEILEIPQLMDTCVRNSYYEEALELAAYVRRLERKYSSIPVIQVANLPREDSS